MSNKCFMPAQIQVAIQQQIHQEARRQSVKSCSPRTTINTFVTERRKQGNKMEERASDAGTTTLSLQEKSSFWKSNIRYSHIFLIRHYRARCLSKQVLLQSSSQISQILLELRTIQFDVSAVITYLNQYFSYGRVQHTEVEENPVRRPRPNKNTKKRFIQQLATTKYMSKNSDESLSITKTRTWQFMDNVKQKMLRLPRSTISKTAVLPKVHLLRFLRCKFILESSFVQQVEQQGRPRPTQKNGDSVRERCHDEVDLSR